MTSNRLFVSTLAAMLAGTMWGCGATPSPTEAAPPEPTAQQAEAAAPSVGSEEAPSYEVLRRGGGGGRGGGRMGGRGGGRGHVSTRPSGGGRGHVSTRPSGGGRGHVSTRPSGGRHDLGRPGVGNRPGWWGQGSWHGHGHRPAWWGSRPYVRNSYVVVGGYYYPYYESDTVGVCYPDYSSPYTLASGQYVPYYTGQPAYGADTVQCSTATVVHY